MNDFKKEIGRLITTVYLIILVVIGVMFSIFLFRYNPQLFMTKKVDPKDWVPKSIDKDLPKGKLGKLIKYGNLLVTETPKWIGPNNKEPELRYAGNNLACQNCHLDAGRKAGSASWVGVANRFPQFSNRENKITTLKDRINGCMERSMNGHPLPKDGNEMKAMIAYMEWLSEDVPEERINEFIGFSQLEIPDGKADLAIGRIIYEKECQLCHGENGAGVKSVNEPQMYQYPPLWGADSYNHGAGMNRVLTAAQFIKSNMPWGQATWDNPKLTDEEAFHVAAYIDSFNRPQKTNSESDYPDYTLKPVSTPYGPWADNFSPEQHKYGPFRPIISYYEIEFDLIKTN